jgi:hypothetical protein
MPEDEQSYNIRFQSDVQDYVAKSDAVIRKTNEVSEAFERMKGSAKGSAEGPISPFRAQIASAVRELKQMQSSTLYGPKQIEEQQRKVEELRKKDRAYEAQIYKQEQQREKEKRNEESAAKKKQLQEDRLKRKEEKDHEHELSRIRMIVNRALYSVGLGRVAPAVNTALSVGGNFLNGAAGSLFGGRLGIPMLGALAGGGAAIGALFHQMKGASDSLIQKTPGWGDFAQRAEYTMPETALEKTKTARGFKLGLATTSSAVGEMLAGWWDKGLKGLEALGPLGGGVGMLAKQWTLGGAEQAEAQDREYEMQRQLNVSQATRELRLRSLGRMMGGVEGSLQIGAQDEMSKMGYYATAGQAYASNENRQLNQEMINTMKKLVEVMESKGSDASYKTLTDVFGWRGK